MYMREEFLQYVWLHQRFNHENLFTTDGKEIQIIHQGFLNYDSGPDFSMAKILIDQILWSGNVEIHYNSSDWLKHKHQNNKAYDNVILHIVWKDDKVVNDLYQNKIPTLELKNKVENSLIAEYNNLLKSTHKIPCENYFCKIEPLIKHEMLDKAMASRLEVKSLEVLKILNKNNGDWEEMTYQLLGKNFGFKTNSAAMETICNKLSLKVLLKQAPNITQIEALLFGTSGLLDQYYTDEYPKQLKNEYNFLAQKHGLQQKKMTAQEWKFSKLRPANFPTIRIAELASIMAIHQHLFSKLIEAEQIESIIKLFKIKTSEYWHSHFIFDKSSPTKAKGLGLSSIYNIILNTVVPLLVCYAKEKGNQTYMDRAIRFLEQIPSEENHITKYFQTLGQKNSSAFESQAILELYNNFCKRKLCLNCSIGNNILKKNQN
ncbi:MAG: DUF2851 family protein [Cytophagales bacterium]|nr:MAG: DUF2851 family protein [Cytophagales bacterium]